MKIALFSDIHANLPALQAFFTDIDARQPDAIYCLGDLVGYNIWPNEVINESPQAAGSPPSQATTTSVVSAAPATDCGCAYKTDREERPTGPVSISFTNELVKEEERAVPP